MPPQIIRHFHQLLPPLVLRDPIDLGNITGQCPPSNDYFSFHHLQGIDIQIAPSQGHGLEALSF